MGISEEIEEMMITAEKTRVLGLKQRFKILNNKDETLSHVVKQKNKLQSRLEASLESNVNMANIKGQTLTTHIATNPNNHYVIPLVM